MSKENVQTFFKLVEADETLRTSYLSFLKGLAEAKPDEKSANLEVVKFADQHGVQFSAEDLSAVASEMNKGDLSDEQLQDIAGGPLGWFMIWCGSGETKHGQFCVIMGGAW
ncbi:MAG: Nif11 domain [Pseudomonadota bacterium]|nr:Nif11 domain [Pseudomonadota bacterium]